MSFKICVIGCGGMSTWVHGPSFKRYAQMNSDTQLAACCDLDIERAKDYADKFGFESTYVDLYEMLDEVKPDAVSLISRVTDTKNLSIEIIKKGYPLIMEKPPGLNEEECRAIISASKQYNVPARVAFNRRYQPLMLEFKKLLQAGGLNSCCYNIYYNMLRNKRYDKDFSTTTIHAIDSVSFLANSPYKAVKLQYQHLPQYGENVSNIYINAEMVSGAVARLEFIVDGGGDVERCIINGANNTFLYDAPCGGESDGKLVQLQGKKVVSELCARQDEYFLNGGFYNENAAFFDMVKSGAQNIGDVEGALQSVIIADAIRKRKESIVF